jgi:hypothetical protein
MAKGSPEPEGIIPAGMMENTKEVTDGSVV